MLSRMAFFPRKLVPFTRKQNRPSLKTEDMRVTNVEYKNIYDLVLNNSYYFYSTVLRNKL